MENEKVQYLINMIDDMDIKDKLRLAICMSQSKWSGLIYNTKENYKKFYAMLKEVDPQTAERLHHNDIRRVIRALEVYKTTGKPMSRRMCAATNGYAIFSYSSCVTASTLTTSFIPSPETVIHPA